MHLYRARAHEEHPIATSRLSVPGILLRTNARVEWADGTIQVGWLRAGDAQVFTGAVPAEVARRLLAGEGPGAFTPTALFGPSLALACGGAAPGSWAVASDGAAVAPRAWPRRAGPSLPRSRAQATSGRYG